MNQFVYASTLYGEEFGALFRKDPDGTWDTLGNIAIFPDINREFVESFRPDYGYDVYALSSGGQTVRLPTVNKLRDVRDMAEFAAERRDVRMLRVFSRLNADGSNVRFRIAYIVESGRVREHPHVSVPQPFFGP